MDKKKYPIYWIAAAAATVLVIGLILFFLFRNSDENLKGRAYLKSLDEIKLETVAPEVEAVRMTQWKEALDRGEVNIYSAFANAAILGDSRAQGFADYGFLPESQVLSGIGESVLAASSHKDQLAALQPGYIYFLYGTNDVEGGLGSGQENGYADIVEEQINQLLEVSPSSKIVISSILDVSNEAAAENPGWANLDAYNEQLRQLAEKRGWIFVDNSSLTESTDEGIYEPDGIHFVPSFYPVWASSLIMNSLFS